MNNLSISLEGLPYGVLVVDSAYKLQQINHEGARLCTKLNQVGQAQTHSPNQPLPQSIQKCCRCFLELCTGHPHQPPAWQEVINIEPDLHLRICIKWLEMVKSPSALMLVTVENIATTAKRQARCDALRYGLTQREEEYWALVCQGFSQPEIKDLMYISINTVKKHARSVNFKLNQQYATPA